MKNLFYLSIFAVLLFTLSTFTIPDAHAATFTAVQSGDWNNPATWRGTAPGPSDTVTIPSGIVVTIPSGLTVAVDPGGTITINSGGTIAINSGGTIMITSLHSLFDPLPGGTIAINSGGTIAINSKGVLSNGFGGHITNLSNGIVHNSGTIDNGNGGEINNSGTIYNNSDGIIINNNGIYAGITNLSNGIINNLGIIDNDNTNIAGTIINNFGTIRNLSGGTITNSGAITNNSGGTIDNYGIITNNSGGTIDNYGIIINNSGGTVTNASVFNNHSNGTITNYGIFNNNSNGTINNNSNGTIDNINTMANAGTIANSGDIANYNDSHIINDGNITNNFGGTIRNYGIITNNSASNITNFGNIANFGNITNFSIINNSSGAIIVIYNNGSITNNYSITNDGFIIIDSSGGTITNNSDGTITNSGTITNNSNGTITNYGIINNHSNGTITNYGIINNSGGTITNASIINNNSGGTIANSGIINNLCGGIINNSGTFTGNPIIYSSCKIMFTSGTRQTLATNQVSNAITIQLQHTSSTPVNAGTGGISISLFSTSSGGQFSLQQSPFTPINTVTIPAGSNSAILYYKDAISGSPTITASSGTLTSATTIFTILVSDTTPPVVTLTPSRAPDSNGYYNHPVTFTVTGDDTTTGASNPVICNSLIIYSGPDGNSIAITGHCTDNAGNTGSNSVIIKYDSTAPTIIAPSGITIISKASVSPSLGTPIVSDNLDLSPIVTNNAPASFASGTTTTVTWTVTDHAGNSATATQQVIIKTPGNAINDLIILGNSFGANTNVLGNAAALLNDSNPNNDSGSCGKLDAFINQVNANNSLTSSQKTQLIQLANEIKVSIGC